MTKIIERDGRNFVVAERQDTQLKQIGGKKVVVSTPGIRGPAGPQPDLSAQAIEDALGYEPASIDAVEEAQATAEAAQGAADTVASDLDDHEADHGNPHVTTAAQVGADPAGSASTAQATAIATAAADATAKASAAQAAAIATAASDATTKATAAQSAAQTYADGLVVGLLDDRGNHDASGNLFPSSGGSGSAGAIKKGDLWTISVGGTLGGKAVTVGDVIRAAVDTPGQTSGNWVQTENNIGYVPENAANKTTSISGASTDTQFPSAKLLYDQLQVKAPSANPSFTGDFKVTEANFLTGIISPTQISSNTNDYAPTGFSTCSVMRLTSDASRAITGLAGGANGRQITVCNVGSFDLLFTNEDTGSTLGNRFAIQRGLILSPNKSATFWYDGTSSRWRLVADQDRTVRVLLAADVTNADVTPNTLADVTGLAFSVLAGKTYRFRFFGVFTGASTGTGSRWTLTGPATTQLVYNSNYSLSSAVTNTINVALSTYGLPAACNATSAAANNYFVVEGSITPSADGVVKLQFASEVTVSAITAKATASFVEYEVNN